MVLHQLQVTFASLLPKLIAQAVSMGYEVTLGEAWRTPEQAAYDAAHGTGIINSVHRQRLAIDLNLFRNGTLLSMSGDYEPLGAWWEQQSTKDYTCCWGGRFSRPDGDHFSIEYLGIK